MKAELESEKTLQTGVKSLKNFRNMDEVEAVYRFVYDNNLRRECIKVLDEVKKIAKVMAKKSKRKARKMLQ